MLILKKEGDDDVMTTGPGAGGRQNAHGVVLCNTLQCYSLTVFLCPCNNIVTV